MTIADPLKTDATEKPLSHGKRRKAIKVAGGVALAVALFGGGILAANALMKDEPDPVANASDGLVLQQLTLGTEQADEIIATVRQMGSEDLAKVRDAGIQLQVLAVAMSDLSEQAGSQDLRDATDQLAAGYLGVSVGLVTNSPSATADGVAQLEEAQAAFKEYLGIDQQQPPAEGQPESGN